MFCSGALVKVRSSPTPHACSFPGIQSYTPLLPHVSPRTKPLIFLT